MRRVALAGMGAYALVAAGNHGLSLVRWVFLCAHRPAHTTVGKAELDPARG